MGWVIGIVVFILIAFTVGCICSEVNWKYVWIAYANKHSYNAANRISAILYYAKLAVLGIAIAGCLSVLVFIFTLA